MEESITKDHRSRIIPRIAASEIYEAPFRKCACLIAIGNGVSRTRVRTLAVVAETFGADDDIRRVRPKWYATEGSRIGGEEWRRVTRGRRPYRKQNTRPRDVLAKRKGFMEYWGISQT